ncbi:MAG: competence/damage-inducible protein A [Alistipes sp.]|nr:competence/damage-inducible protein A [Alistipes sp.]
MRASIITVGDEILIGQVVDTNSAFIARQLSDHGWDITGIYTTGDEPERMRSALDMAMAGSDVVIMTGGLGPTRDDITKKVLAGYFGMGLREDENTLNDILEMLRSRHIPLNDLNRSQAMVPDGCTVLRNLHGTAPGMWFDRDGKVVVSLPGVPFEMESLLRTEVLPRLDKKFGAGAAVHRTVHTAGIAESVLAERISGWEENLPAGLKLAYLPSTGGVRLRLSSYDLPPDTAAQLIDSNISELRNLVGPYWLGGEEADPAAAIAKLLQSQKRTLAVAESCTGGRIAHVITLNPGSSAHFLGGVVAYSPGVKISVLGVPQETITQYGVVSRQTAQAMAEGVRKLMKSDYAISTTGIAGPQGSENAEPVGTVWIGIAHPGGSYARKVRFGKLRGPNIERASNTALNLLRLLLEGNPDAPVAGGIF